MRAVFLGALLAIIADAADAPKIVTTGAGIEMALIAAGKFTMGDEKGAPDERPRHEVEISAFYLDRTEVTQAQFEKIMGYNSSKIVHPENPADRVRWLEAIEFCNERSQREGLEPAYDLDSGACNFSATGYRLPTEAEWEYACRVGSGTRFFFGDDPAALDAFAWFDKNAGKKSHPAGTKKPNPFGLHDMAGSLLEWCNDWYAPDYYKSLPAKDPAGPATGKQRVLRGGCWQMKAEQCRSAIRFHDDPANADACFGWENYGFRCARRAAAQ